MRSPGKDSAQDEAERLKHRTDVLREDLDEIVGELDRRRHRLTRQLQPVGLVAAGVVVAGGLGLALWARHRRRVHPKLAPYAKAMRRLRAHPDRVAKESPSVPNKVAAAVLTTLASMAVRRAFGAAFPGRERRR
jgi:hypothetical protein